MERGVAGCLWVPSCLCFMRCSWPASTLKALASLFEGAAVRLVPQTKIVRSVPLAGFSGFATFVVSRFVGDGDGVKAEYETCTHHLGFFEARSLAFLAASGIFWFILKPWTCVVGLRGCCLRCLKHMRGGVQLATLQLRVHCSCASKTRLSLFLADCVLPPHSKPTRSPRHLLCQHHPPLPTPRPILRLYLFNP